MSERAPLVFRSGHLSNFAPCDLDLPDGDGRIRRYPSVEHYFQASKADDPREHSWIADAPSPREAKRRGRRATLRADWESVKEQVMLEALRAKFAIPAYRSRLIVTGERPIIEESRHDDEWGARRDPDGWIGENKLGRLLEQVRTELLVLDDESSERQLRLPLALCLPACQQPRLRRSRHGTARLSCTLRVPWTSRTSRAQGAS